MLGIVHVHKKNEYLGSLSAGGRLISAITDQTHNKHLNHCPPTLAPSKPPTFPHPPCYLAQMRKHMEKCATCVLRYHRESGAAAALLSVACACCPTSSCSSSLSTPTLAMSQARRLNGDMRMCGRSGVGLIETLSMAGGPLQDLRIVFEMTVTVR